MAIVQERVQCNWALFDASQDFKVGAELRMVLLETGKKGLRKGVWRDRLGKEVWVECHYYRQTRVRM